MHSELIMKAHLWFTEAHYLHDWYHLRPRWVHLKLYLLKNPFRLHEVQEASLWPLQEAIDLNLEECDPFFESWLLDHFTNFRTE